MKTCSLLILGSVILPLGLSTGCSKQEPTEAPTTQSQSATSELKKTEDAAQTGAAKAQDAVANGATDVQAKAGAMEKATGDSVAAAKDQGAAAMTNVQELIDKAKTYIAQKNWTEALKELGSLSAMNLTPDQQSTVNSLKAEAQKMAQDAAATNVKEQAGKTVGDLLDKK